MHPTWLVLPFLLTGACTVHVATHSVWCQRSAAGLQGRTAQEVLHVDCPDQATTVTLQLDSACTAGELHVRVLDPKGSVRCDDRLQQGERSTSLCWPAQPGTWRCELVLDGFGGSYGLELHAAGQPLSVQLGIEGVEFDTDR